MCLGLVLATARAAEPADVAAVKSVLKTYQTALERLDGTAATKLFAADSEVFESGGVEGSFAHYLEHHLGPELGEFKGFSFRDYQVEVRLELPLALATETYIYRIVLKEDGRAVERRGVTTSVLKKIGGEWRIIQTHNSSRSLSKKN